MTIRGLWRCYMPLLRGEWVKMVHARGLLALLLIGIAAYTWMTASYYHWQAGPVEERFLSFPYTFGTLITGLAIILSQAHSFNREHLQRMAPLLASTRHGRRLLAGAKIGAALLLTLCLFVLLWGYHWTWHAVLDKWPNFALPLDNLERYTYTALDLSVGRYFWLLMGQHLLGICAFSLMVMLLSARIRSVLAVYFLAGLALALPFFIRPSLTIRDWTDLLFLLIKYLPPTETMRVEGFFTFSRIVEFGTWRFALPLGWPAIYTVLFGLLALWGIFRLAGRTEDQ